MHRTTLYSNLTYILKGKVYKVRPDALIHVNNGVYSIEIDLLTETQEQLIEKFQKYKAYLESAASKHGPQLHTILFVLPERVRRYGLKRRWMTILTAFYKVFKEFTDVNLILCSVDELATILEFEQKREQIQQDRITYLSNKCVNEDSYISFSINGQLCLAKDDEYIVLIIQCHHEFEARIYRDYYDLYLAEKEFPLTVRVRKINDDMGLFNFSGYKGQFCTPIRKPEWLEGLENTGIPIHLLEKIKKTHDYINRYRVVNI
ncbi:replication-relaxation family protein [Lysinibacillus pakistanensis]|uniref:replication-relaxation family protein n=1 Tax=Lysinibacillus pakistanensis TaxID=759811 RepID=UPI003D279480